MCTVLDHERRGSLPTTCSCNFTCDFHAGALGTPWQTQCNEAMPWSGKQFGTLNCVPAGWPPEASKIRKSWPPEAARLDFAVGLQVTCNQCLSCGHVTCNQCLSCRHVTCNLCWGCGHMTCNLCFSCGHVTMNPDMCGVPKTSQHNKSGEEASAWDGLRAEIFISLLF